MRRWGAIALGVALLLLAPAGTGAALADTASSVGADDIFYPGDQPPADAAGTAQGSDDDPADSPAASADDREAAMMRGSREAADLLGYLPSLYQGKWYVPEDESVRRCIMDRESNFNYRATSGTYHGAYQMSAALGRGATWMMQKEVRRELGEEGVTILKTLRELTPNKWNRYWQDRAFWTIWRKGAGSGHWAGGASRC